MTIEDLGAGLSRHLSMVVTTRHAVDNRLGRAPVGCRERPPGAEVRVVEDERSIASAMLWSDEAGLGIPTEPMELCPELLYLLVDQWRLFLVAPRQPALRRCASGDPTLERLADLRGAPTSAQRRRA
jgi:hypothetical protein